jgi:hypothetical protein
MSEGRNIQQSGGSMPLFTVTMKSNGSPTRKTTFPELSMLQALLLDIQRTTFFQRFLSLGPSDFRVDLYYPALPKPRADQMLMIEVLVSSATETNRKKVLLPP